MKNTVRTLYYEGRICLDTARKAARIAETITDADAKEAMLELSLFYLGKAVVKCAEPNDCQAERLRLAPTD